MMERKSNNFQLNEIAKKIKTEKHYSKPVSTITFQINHYLDNMKKSIQDKSKYVPMYRVDIKNIVQTKRNVEMSPEGILTASLVDTIDNHIVIPILPEEDTKIIPPKPSFCFVSKNQRVNLGGSKKRDITPPVGAYYPKVIPTFKNVFISSLPRNLEELKPTQSIMNLDNCSKQKIYNQNCENSNNESYAASPKEAPHVRSFEKQVGRSSSQLFKKLISFDAKPDFYDFKLENRLPDIRIGKQTKRKDLFPLPKFENEYNINYEPIQLKLARESKIYKVNFGKKKQTDHQKHSSQVEYFAKQYESNSKIDEVQFLHKILNLI